MFYSPILDLYFKHEKYVHDFFVQFIIIIIAYVVDTYAVYEIGLNTPFLSLLIFIICYTGARYIIRVKEKQNLFGGFANYGVYYAFFLAIGCWLAYFLFIRLPRFT